MTDSMAPIPAVILTLTSWGDPEMFLRPTAMRTSSPAMIVLSEDVSSYCWNFSDSCTIRNGVGVGDGVGVGLRVGV